MTDVVPVRRVPVIVTTVPPANRPDVGVTSVMIGSFLYVNVRAVDEPPGPIATTFAIPADLDGELTTIRVSVCDVTFAEVPPNVTLVTSPRFVPLSVTVVPPSTVPDVGDTEDTTGRKVES